MIMVSKEAIEKFEEIRLNTKNPQKAMLRVTFGGASWIGPRLQLTLDELKNEDDVVVESQGIKVVYKTDIQEYLSGSIIDYSNSVRLNMGFLLKHPLPLLSVSKK